jgi:3-dehydroquinate dehydratase/shikimate dehydrogenase
MMERAAKRLWRTRDLLNSGWIRLPSLRRLLPKLKEFLAAHRDATAIATCRRKQFGGHFVGSLTAEFEVLSKRRKPAARLWTWKWNRPKRPSRPRWRSFAMGCGRREQRCWSASTTLPRRRDLEHAAERIEAFQPDFVKVVSTARTLADNLAVLRLIEERSLSAQVVGIAMGEEGLVSRVLGPRAGAAFTFASYSDGAETAPGQVTARVLRDLYRVEQLDQATRIFGVAGNPIAHSLSPLMQNTAFRKEGVNAVLLPLKVRALSDLLTLVRELPLSGLAVTMPLKQEILPHLANPVVGKSLPLTKGSAPATRLRVGATARSSASIPMWTA